jgi:hypothetical protein
MLELVLRIDRASVQTGKKMGKKVERRFLYFCHAITWVLIAVFAVMSAYFGKVATTNTQQPEGALDTISVNMREVPFEIGSVVTFCVCL